MRLRLAGLLLVLALALAGCNGTTTASTSASTSPAPGSLWRPEPRPELINGCLLSVCNADEGSHDYKVIFEKTGLRGINYDRHRELGVGIDGDLVVWQIDRKVNGTENADTFAYNVTQDRLYAVGWQSYYWQTLFDVSHGRIVLSEGSNWQLPEAYIEQPRRHSLVLWTEATQERRILNTGLGPYGGPTPIGFDGVWVAFSNSNADNLNNSGLYAINVDSGEVVPLWIVGQNLDNNLAAYAATVVDGVAYYEVHTKEGDWRFWLHEFNLTTKQDRVVHEGMDYKGFGSFMRSSHNYVVWYTDWNHQTSVLYYYNRTTGNAGPLTDGMMESLHASFDMDGDWAIYQSTAPRGGGEQPIVAMHIPTKTRIVLVKWSQKLYPGVVATDGVRFVVGLFRNDSSVYDVNDDDLYWGKFSDIWPDATQLK